MNVTRWTLAASLVFVSCGSPLARAVRTQRFTDACALQGTRSEDREGDDALREALFSRGDLRVHATVVPEDETSQAVGVTVSGDELRVVRWRVEVRELFPEATSLELTGLSVGAPGQEVGWAAWDRRHVDTVCAPRAPPATPAYRKRPYTPTPRPDVPTRTVRRSAPERVIGGILGALSLGLLKAEDSFEVTTPAGEAKLLRWARENEALRQAWDTAEQQHFDEVELSRAEEKARAARWPDECRAALTPHLDVHCSGKGPLGTLVAGDSCEWTVLMRPPWQADTQLFVFSKWRLAGGCELEPPALVTSPLTGVAGLEDLFKSGPRRMQR